MSDNKESAAASAEAQPHNANDLVSVLKNFLPHVEQKGSEIYVRCLQDGMKRIKDGGRNIAKEFADRVRTDDVRPVGSWILTAIDAEVTERGGRKLRAVACFYIFNNSKTHLLVSMRCMLHPQDKVAPNKPTKEDFERIRKTMMLESQYCSMGIFAPVKNTTTVKIPRERAVQFINAFQYFLEHL